MRAATAAAGVLLLTCAVPAGATKPTPKPVCRVMADARGDEGLAPLGGTPVGGVPADDLLSADVASDGRTLTAVFRMAALADADAEAPMGRQYTVLFEVAHRPDLWFVRARTSPLGTTYAYGQVTTGLPLEPQTVVLGDARGSVDAERHEVHVSVPATRVGLHRGARLVALRAAVGRLVGDDLDPQVRVAGLLVPTSLTQSVDLAEGRDYVVGTPSCVRVGA